MLGGSKFHSCGEETEKPLFPDCSFRYGGTRSWTWDDDRRLHLAGMSVCMNIEGARMFSNMYLYCMYCMLMIVYDRWRRGKIEWSLINGVVPVGELFFRSTVCLPWWPPCSEVSTRMVVPKGLSQDLVGSVQEGYWMGLASVDALDRHVRMRKIVGYARFALWNSSQVCSCGILARMSRTLNGVFISRGDIIAVG